MFSTKHHVFVQNDPDLARMKSLWLPKVLFHHLDKGKTLIEKKRILRWNPPVKIPKKNYDILSLISIPFPLLVTRFYPTCVIVSDLLLVRELVCGREVGDRVPRRKQRQQVRRQEGRHFIWKQNKTEING